MAKYGIPYQGSKSAIADDIIRNLPSGNRLVDLFGGGFAISHCALLSQKWKKVLYNDINPLLITLIKDAIAGKYSYENFTPEWISHDEFLARKETDGYVKWCWSFGNDGRTYLYGKDIEEIKHKAHDFCVYGKQIEGIDLVVNSDNITERRLALNKYCKNKFSKRMELQQLEATERLSRLEYLERLSRVQQLERLERVQDVQNVGIVYGKLEMTCMDYREYQYQDGDVVYCDIPYQNGVDPRAYKNYQVTFDHGAFYTWAITRPYPVYFSSYKLGGVVWEQDKIVLKSAHSNGKKRREVLYCVDDNFQASENIYQRNLFERIQ